MTAALVTPRPAQLYVEPQPARSSYNYSVGYLRAFITLLVLAHHAVLAYHPFAPPPPSSLLASPRWWHAFPVTDSQHWSGFAALVGFNDTFFMALMFFVSGVFVWQSLRRKGAGNFVRDREMRLGWPFVAAAAVIAPLAYYPAYLQSGDHATGFWHQWMSLGNWPAGPAWFVWVLLAFDLMAALIFVAWPTLGEKLSRLASGTERRPLALFAALLLISGVCYVPLAIILNPMRWSAFGPFTVQTSRVLHYFVYFLFGVGVGAGGLDRGLLARSGTLATRWWLWSIGAVPAFVVTSGVGIAALTIHIGSRPWEIAADCAFVLSCAASSFAFLAVFVRFAIGRNRVFDSLAANAYGMYLIHYAFSSWLQYSLLKSYLPGIAKGSLVFLATVLLSWGMTSLLRRFPAVSRVI